MMAFLYPWATKEYLLWNMTIGQIIMYHNRGIELHWPGSTTNSTAGLTNKSASELRKIRDEVLKQANMPLPPSREELKQKYGDIG